MLPETRSIRVVYARRVVVGFPPSLRVDGLCDLVLAAVRL